MLRRVNATKLKPKQPIRCWLFAVALVVTSCGDADQDDLPGGIERQELLAASQTGLANSAARFRLVPPGESGLAFKNELLRDNRYTYLTNGAGMAIGDYDGDGLLDAYLVSQDGANKLFRQTAPMQFEDVTIQAGDLSGGEAWGAGASFADVDGDYDLDLYVCNVEAKNLLYENQGDGTFIESGKKFGLDLLAASTMAAFADYDRDGQLDLYLLTNRALHAGWTNTPEVLRGFRPPSNTATALRDLVPSKEQWQRLGDMSSTGALQDDPKLPDDLAQHFFVFRGKVYSAGQPDRLLRNVGGKFVDVTQSAGIQDHGMGLSASWCDYDDDGYPDLYVANDLESPDVLYHNEGDGRFRNVTKDVVPHTAYYGMGSDSADVDGDGFLDLVVADMSMTTHKKAKVLMGDMNEERPVLQYSEPPQCMRNALLLNTGMGKFQEAAKLAGMASTDWTWSVLFGDLDQDTRIDLFATNGIARFDTDPDLKLLVEQLWRDGQQQAAIQRIQNVAAVPEKNIALRNVRDLQFDNPGAEWGLDLEAVSHGAALADFDGDGDLDVLVNNFEAPAALYENQTNDGKSIVVRLKGQRSNSFGLGARCVATLSNGKRIVRELTLSRGYLSGQAPELHFGLGDADTVDLSVTWPSGHIQQFAGLASQARYIITESSEPPSDSGDATHKSGKPALFEPGTTVGFRHQENEFDEYRQQPLLPAAVSRLGPALAANQDYLFVGGAHLQAGSLYRRVADAWQEVDGPWQQDAACEDVGATLLDYDGDQDLDLVVTSGGSEVAAGHAQLQDRLYKNNDGIFVKDEQALPDVRESSGRVIQSDYDKDGDIDLFIAGRLIPGSYPDAPSSHLYENEGGTFRDVTTELAPALAKAGMVTDAVFADANGDGHTDLLVAARWQPIRFLRFDGKRYVDQTEESGLSSDVGWWNALCSVDVDGDGDLDLIAGNQGLNTKYSASPERPARLYYSDFDEDGRRDLVEAKYEGDRLLPVRGRSCSSGAMPMVAEKFPTYERFASAVLQDIYSKDKLAACGELVATQLASCLLRNDGLGNFVVEPLPHRAQISPINAIVLVDQLLICAQNQFSPEPETGRHDGGAGLVLRIAGKGLHVLSPQEHGILMFGDCRGIAPDTKSQAKAVWIARNDNTVLNWRRSRISAR